MKKVKEILYIAKQDDRFLIPYYSDKKFKVWHKLIDGCHGSIGTANEYIERKDSLKKEGYSVVKVKIVEVK